MTKRRRNARPMGIRLNNPLNLHTSERMNYEGLHPRTPDCNGYCHFTDLEHGYLAAIRLMMLYMGKYNLLTPAAIIYRWAPATHNKTHLYLAAVCAMAGLDQNDIIEDTSIEMLELLVAMTRMETGLRPDVTELMDICGKYGIV